MLKTIFNKNLVAIYESKSVLTLDKTIYLGFSILNLSKLLMYKFHYKYIKTKYDKNAKLLFKDTNILVYEIKTGDVYEDFYENKSLFDFSDYPKDSNFFDLLNKKVIGKLKDEVQGKIISEFVGLKSKLYSLVTVGNRKVKKQKESVKMLLKT